jgi:hypothetical protein
VANSIAWGWYLIVSATGLWIVQLILVSSGRAALVVLLSEHAILEKQQRNLTIAVVMAGGGVTTVTGAPTGMAPMSCSAWRSAGYDGLVMSTCTLVSASSCAHARRTNCLAEVLGLG